MSFERVGAVLGVVIVVVAVAWKVWKEIPDTKRQLNGYEFGETLRSTVKADGADARVIFVLVRDDEFSYSVLARDGNVSERFYGPVCHKASRSAGSSCIVKPVHHSRRSSSSERELAEVRLGDIDDGVVDQLRKATHAEDLTAIGLRGSQWIVGGFPAGRGRPGYIADVDGSHLHVARTAREEELAEAVATDVGVDRGD